MEERKENEYPIVEIGGMDFSESNYKKGNYVYSAASLYRHAEKLKLVPFDMPLAGFNLNIQPFTLKNLADFIFHVKRVESTSLEYPIIFDNEGQLADGYHRVISAILRGETTIKAYRLPSMPDYEYEETED